MQAGLLAGVGLAADLTVTTVDTRNQPLADVRIQLRRDAGIAYSVNTGRDGRATFSQVKPGHYDLSLEKGGLEPRRSNALDLTGALPLDLEFTLIPSLARHDTVEVKADASSPQQETSVSTELPPQIIRDLPGRPATVSDALPLVPGVFRQPGGGLIISAAGEHRSALVVNSTDVTDPATGQFGLTVPVDVVEKLSVYQTPFLAEYGRFSAGVVSVETRRGADKWQWALNDPFPEFRIRSYQLRGLKTATPRLNFEGPLIEGKLYFSEGVDYEARKTEVFELPFPKNQKLQEGLNSFSQLDWIASDRQLVTATVHVARQRLDFVNLDYFNPEPTTPDASTQNYTASISDKLTIFGGILDNTVATTRFGGNVWGQGQQDFTIAPQGNSGTYFAQQNRQSSRVGWASTLSPGAVAWAGRHSFKAGTYVAVSSDQGQIEERTTNLLDGAGHLLERIGYTGGQPFHMRDVEGALFAQDHWMLSPKLALDLGIRTESQERSESFRIAPRGGVAWTPFSHTGTVVHAGYGLFYDRLPLNVYSFDRYPEQSISFFGTGGQFTAGPFLYQNSLGTNSAPSPLIIRGQSAGNFSPRSMTGSFQVEQPLSSYLQVRIGFMQNQSTGLVILNHTTPDLLTGVGSNILTGNGQSRYRQFEATARLRWNDKRQLFFSYVRSSARGDLNDFSTYLSTFAVPVLRNNQFGNLPTNLPNRFLAWGLVQLPWGFRAGPLIEYRSGLPYAVTDATQNYAGVPYGSRFPTFFSLDARVSKDFKVTPKYTFRFSVSSFNLTDHFNPGAVHANTADPAYGSFIGQRGRHFTADFDVIF